MAQDRRTQGLHDSELLDRSQAYRDPRPLHRQALSALHRPWIAVAAIGSTLALTVVFPWAFPVTFAFALGLLANRIGYDLFIEEMPLRQPWFLRSKDPHDPLPNDQPSPSRGLLYIGNERETDLELWLSANDVLNHVLVFGATGAGKSEFMLSMAFTYIAAGSGIYYIDPKAALKLWSQIHVMARLCGRDDDLRLLNFMTAGLPTRKKRTGRHPFRRTNSTNQLAFLSADACIQLIASMMPKPDGANAVFAQNALSLLAGLIYPLVYLRDSGEIDLSMGTVRTYIDREKAAELSQRADIPMAYRGALATFLANLGYKPGLPSDKQPRNFAEQYSYANNYFNLALTSLVETYRDIFETTAGEVDMLDMIINRRIVLSLLPTLEKSAQECENLGKISLSAVRGAIAVGLGDKPEGTIDQTLNSLPLNAEFPFASITDEYAAIPVPGYAEVATQGRGLGIAAIIGTQDVPGIRESDPKGYNQIVANTRVRAFGRVADVETAKLAMELAGEAFVTRQTRMTRLDQRNQGQQNLNFRDDGDVAIEKTSRIDLRDMQKQNEGKYHLLMDGHLVRSKVFYSDIPLDPRWEVRLVRMVRPRRPDKRMLSMKYGPIKEMVAKINAYGADPALINMAMQDAPQPREALVTALRPPLRGERGGKPAAMSRMDLAVAAFVRFSTALATPESAAQERGEGAGSGGREGADDGRKKTLSGALAHAQAWLFPSDEDDDLEQGLTQIEIAAGAPPEAAREAAAVVLDAVHADLRYPDSSTPPPEKGNDTVLDAIHTLMERARAGEGKDGGR